MQLLSLVCPSYFAWGAPYLWRQMLIQGFCEAGALRVCLETVIPWQLQPTRHHLQQDTAWHINTCLPSAPQVSHATSDQHAQVQASCSP